MKNHPKALASTLAKAAIHNAHSMLLLTGGFAFYPPDRTASKIKLDAQRNPDDEILVLSSFKVRSAVQKALIVSSLSLFEITKRDPRCRVFFFTFSPAEAISYEDEPHFNVDQLRRKTRRLLRRMGLEGICAFEIDVLADKLPGEHARRVILHVHGLCLTRDATFQPVAATRELCELPQYRNSLGIPAISLETRAMARSRSQPGAPNFELVHAHPKRDQTARSMAWLAYYMTKAPRYAKNLYVDPDGRQRSRYDGHAFRLKTALRLNEMWSHFTPEQLVFSTGPTADQARLSYRTQLRREFGFVGYGRWQKRWRDALGCAWSHYFDQYRGLGFRPSVITHRS